MHGLAFDIIYNHSLKIYIMPNNEDATKTFATQEDADNNVSAIQQNELDADVDDDAELEEDDIVEDEADEIDLDDETEGEDKDDEV